MLPNDETARLAYETRRLHDAIDDKGELWDDQGGRTTLHEYLLPHAEAAEDLVAALREQDELLAAFDAEMAIVERELEAAAAAHAQMEASLARATEDLRSADTTVAEVLQREAAVAKLEARAVRFADLANGYPGAQGPPPILVLPQTRTERVAVLRHLQEEYPRLEVAHILEGGFNHKGHFSGFHSRKSQIGVVMTNYPPDIDGLYEAVVAGVRPDGTKVPKNVRKHTMFPDSWSGDRICREILSAYETPSSEMSTNGRWRGVSQSGLRISGHLRDHNLIIGHPVMEE